MENLIKKQNQGITLIALVITVIVMLIISAVAITAITDPEGIFRQAREAGENYNTASQNEADVLGDLTNNEWFLPKTDGSFDASLGINTPNTSKLPKETTKYITWNENNGVYSEDVSDKQVKEWYDYTTGKWANIKTTSTDKSLEAYWVWIPRFAYRLPESSTPKTIEVVFVKNTGTEGVNGEKCYYATDTSITAGGTGLYVDATEFAKGTEEGKEQAWIVHPAFTFGDKQLSGIWVAKFEASNNNEKVEVKPSVTAWDNISTVDIFRVCREMQNTGMVIGTTTGTSTVDTHMIKNMEWGAVAVLSQSIYGYYENGVNKQVWNNPNSSEKTGYASSSENGQDAATLEEGMCDSYNEGNGPKSSTTGNIYGVYDMAGGCFEYVAGVLQGAENTKLGTTDTKYFDSYTNATQNALDRTGGKIGDLTAELLPENTNVTWNNDLAGFIRIETSSMHKGGGMGNGENAGIFRYNYTNDESAAESHSFRPTLCIL